MEWYGYREENSEKSKGIVFQQWMEREGRQAVHQKIAQRSTHLVHEPAWGAGVSGSGAQKQPQKDQGPQQESARQSPGPNRRQRKSHRGLCHSNRVEVQDTREEAATRAAAALANAKKYPVCEDVHMFNIRKHDSIKFPSTQLDSSKKFKEMSPECKDIELEEQSGCELCTSFAHKRERRHLKRRGQTTPMCGVLEGNKICGREHHPLLHLSKSSYFSATTLLMSAASRPTYKKRSRNQTDLGRPNALGRSWASLFAVLRVPIKAVGGARRGIAFIMEDKGATENFIMHTLAKELSLARTPATVINTSIEGTNEHQDTYKYQLKMVDARRYGHPVTAFGIDSIRNIEQVEDVATLKRLPSAPQTAATAFNRPHREISLMIGMKNR